jgi:hypothetical protein
VRLNGLAEPDSAEPRFSSRRRDYHAPHPACVVRRRRVDSVPGTAFDAESIGYPADAGADHVAAADAERVAHDVAGAQPYAHHVALSAPLAIAADHAFADADPVAIGRARAQ